MRLGRALARGVLVESARRPRPTKIDQRNPRHAESGGATDAVTQASIRDLYDPDRSRVPRQGGQIASWARFEADWSRAAQPLRARTR